MTQELDMIVFDMDGVLVDAHSSWKWVHERFGVDNEASLKAYMNNEIDDLEFIRRDIELWKSIEPNISKKDIVDMLSDAPLMDGFDECIPYLGENYITAVISGGLKPLAEMIGEGHFDKILANDIEERSGELTGEGIVEVGLKKKGEAFERLIAETGIKRERCAAVGNSYIDVPMIEKAGLGIAFNPGDQKIREAADMIVEEKDLSLLLEKLDL
ncbi:MAG: HAD-IB family phosphatase [Candidatus Thermoplasmatota archaeon]